MRVFAAAFMLLRGLSLLQRVHGVGIFSFVASTLAGSDIQIVGTIDIFRPWNTFTNMACLIRFGMLLVTSGDSFLLSMYGDESEGILAQSGIYNGPKDIRTYIGFTTKDSPYFISRLAPASAIKPLGVQDGMCTILNPFRHRFLTERETTGESTTFEVIGLLKYVMPFDGKWYLKHTNVFYRENFLSYFFGDLLGTSKIQDYVCETVLNDVVCAPYLLAGSQEDCINSLGALDVAEVPGLAGDGNSLGCRVLHTSFAVSNPEAHCAHVSLTA